MHINVNTVEQCFFVPFLDATVLKLYCSNNEKLFGRRILHTKLDPSLSLGSSFSKVIPFLQPYIPCRIIHPTILYPGLNFPYLVCPYNPQNLRDTNLHFTRYDPSRFALNPGDDAYTYIFSLICSL